METFLYVEYFCKENNLKAGDGVLCGFIQQNGESKIGALLMLIEILLK